MRLRDYTKREEMVPTRDGAKLYTAIYSPADKALHPVLMMRTPYALRPYGKGFAKNLRGYMRGYMERGYIIVYQNVRGTFLSEGVYENLRPLSKQKEGVDEATDTYDTIEWLLSHTACDGRIGVTGNSYAGFYAVMAVLSRHPAIKAACIQAPVTDWWMGDDAHRRGSFMLLGMYGFGGSFFRVRKRPGIRSLTSTFKVEEGTDLRDHFLGKGLGEILAPVRKSGKERTFWQELIAHPHYDEFWKERCPLRQLHDLKPSIMVVGGTFDAEDGYGSLRTYEAIRHQSPQTELYFTLGPWAHGAWRSRDPEGLGDYYLDEVEGPFFAYYLEGKGERPKTARVIASNGKTWPCEEIATGLSDPRNDAVSIRLDKEVQHVVGDPAVARNDAVSIRLDKEDVMTFTQWPPKCEMRRVYLDENGLSANEPKNECGVESGEEGNGARSYVSDPFDPVPFQEEEIDFWPRDYMYADQTFTLGRKDVLSYEGEPLKDELRIFGPVKAVLRVSTSTEDADLVVKLIDVRPDGYRMLVRVDVLPLRYRKDYEKSVAMRPGEAESVEMVMNDIAHVFRTGHRLMVQVQSSLFPLMAMNPQRLVPNIYEATAADFTPCRVTIHSGSYIELPLHSLDSSLRSE